MGVGTRNVKFCPRTRKRTYSSFAQAMKANHDLVESREGRVPLMAYRCRYCYRYHLTSVGVKEKEP